MKRHPLFPALLVLGALAAGSCTKPQPVDFAGVCTAANEKKTIVTDGFLRIGSSVFCSNTGGGPVTCGLELHDPQGGEKKISAYVVRGTGDNQVEELPRGYKKEDLKLRDDTGALVGPDDRLRVTGVANYAEGSGTQVCFINVSKIEKQ
jgi:hypothetical protein